LLSSFFAKAQDEVRGGIGLAGAGCRECLEWVVTATAASPATLVGQSETHLCSAEDATMLGARAHRDVIAPFLELKTAAAAQGFDLAIDSGFRSFERQLSIWNRKANGELAVLDGQARPLNIARLDPRDLVFAILRWSALPGASRHHWGADLDVFDRAATPAGYQIQLIPREVEAGAMFAPLHEWLDQRIADGAAFGFFRPYDVDRGGVAPERWHLSYAPVARQYLRLLTVDLLRATVERADLALKDVVLTNLAEIYRRFVITINPMAS
jgi:LAS superfamily LD-carboxypeptidase LdcB